MELDHEDADRTITATDQVPSLDTLAGKSPLPKDTSTPGIGTSRNKVNPANGTDKQNPDDILPPKVSKPPPVGVTT